MEPAFERWTEKENVGLCLWAKNGTIFFQNQACQATCGERTGTVCNIGCRAMMKPSHLSPSNEEATPPTQLFTNRLVQDGLYDVVVMPGDGLSLTMLKPRRASVELIQKAMKSGGLTLREAQVSLLAIQGLTNSQICDRLTISRATLKTHLNRAYRKLGPNGYLLGRVAR